MEIKLSYLAHMHNILAAEIVNTENQRQEVWGSQRKYVCAWTRWLAEWMAG